MMSSCYQTFDLGCSYGPIDALSDLNLSIPTGEIVGIVGPNGAGKTTLLKALCGLIGGYRGAVHFQGRPLKEWSPRDLSRSVAYVPQRTQILFPFTAREVVLMGRLPHQRGLYFDRPEDRRVVQQALEMTDSLAFAERPFNELSGGEQQLVALASALAQKPQVLLLDEPTVFLDLKHQLQIFKILRILHERSGTTLILVTHDLEAAEGFCSRLFFLKQGRLQAELDLNGEGRKVPAELIESVFDVRASEFGEGRGRRILLSFGD